MALSTTHNVNLSDGGGRTLDERKLDGMDIDAESFYYSYKLITKAVESANSFERQLDSKSIDSDVIKQLGCDFSAVKKYEKDALKDLKDLWTRMIDTKRLLSVSSSSSSTIFNGIDAQYELQELMEFGDLEDEAVQKKYWDCLVDIYHGAKAKYVNGDVSSPLALTASDIAGYSGLNEVEKYAVQQMQETGYDIYDMYLDYSKMQTQRDKYQAEIHDYEWALYDAQNINGPYYSTERAKYYQEKIWELAALDWNLQEKMDAMEPTLKQAGYVEYTGWEQIGNAFKKMGEDWKTAWDYLWDGEFSEAWNAAGTALKSTKSTFFVMNEKIHAGGLKIVEYVTDGVILIGGGIASGVASLLCDDEETSKDIWEGTMAVVAEDVVGDLEKVFYEHNALGKTINENSYLKYDSEGAEMFKKGGVKAVETAAAIAVGACTCGTGSLLVVGGVGFLEGLGEGAERQFNITDDEGNYIRRNMTGVALSGLNGIGKSVELVGYAKMGRGLGAAFGNQQTSAKEMGKLATKLDTALADKPKVLRVAAKTIVNGDTAVEMAGAGARYVSTGIETGDWKEGLGELGLNTALILGGNFVTQWKLDGTMKPYSGKNAIMKADDVPPMPEVPLGDDLPAGVSINANGEIVRDVPTSSADDFLPLTGTRAEITGINPLDEIDDQIAAATALGDYDAVRALQEQKSALFQEEMTSVFGAENVEHVSGIGIEGANGSFIDPDATEKYVSEVRKRALAHYRSKIDGDDWLRSHISDADFDVAVAKADALAAYYEDAGVMDRATFYGVWGAEVKPDPSTYLPEEYIQAHLDEFTSSGGASRLTAKVDYERFAVPSNAGGRPNAYPQFRDVDYTGGSEFVSPSKSTDGVVDAARQSSNWSQSLATDLSLYPEDANKFAKYGVMRYDIDASEFGKVRLRMPTGNEPGAMALYWVPGGYTLDGVVEGVVDVFPFNGDSITATRLLFK